MNYNSFVGHHFAKIDKNSIAGQYKQVRLESVRHTKEMRTAYSLQSSIYINFISDDLISQTPPAVDGWFDYFDIGDNLKYDQEKMQNDIQKYGLYDYDVFKPYGVTYQQFIDFNGPYLKVLVGKGIVTFDDILSLMRDYVI